jgi:RND family efflux transporter MFP subunit
MSDNKSAEYYRKKFQVTLAVALVVGGSYLARHQIARLFTGGKPAHTEKAATVTERKILYWVAPMDPAYRRNKPGKSPMGMDLVPVYEDAGLGEGQIRIDPVVEQNIGVRTAKTARREISRTINTSGRVTYDERNVVKIQSKTSGWIEKLYVDFTGKHVKKNDYLLEIYSPELVATAEEYILALEYRDSMAKSSLKGASRGGDSLLEASRRRLKFFDVPEHQIKELEKTRTVKKTLHIHSPAGGVVVKKNAIEGMYVTPNMVLYTIADLSRIWVLADIYEYEIPWVEEGQSAVMTLRAIPGKEFKGKVTYIYPYLEEKTRSVQVRMEFDNKNLELKPDMYADIRIASDVKRTSIAVPKEAVIRSGHSSIVLISVGSGIYESRFVRLGVESEEYYEILEGLDEGETIVVSANFLLDSESNLRGAVKKMLSGKKAVVPSGTMQMEKGDAQKDMTNRKGMDHGKMDDGKMDHSKMDHGKMDELQKKETGND